MPRAMESRKRNLGPPWPPILTGNATTLEELAEVAAFVASDRAAAMTGTVANLTGGIIVD